MHRGRVRPHEKSRCSERNGQRGVFSLVGALDRVPSLENESNFTAVRAMEKAEKWESVF